MNLISRLLILSLLFYGCSAEKFTLRSTLITLTGDTFDLDVKVLITNDTAFARSYVRQHLDSNVTTEDFNCRAVTFGTIDGKSPIIWMPYNSSVEILNHELLHATLDVMKWAGISLNDSTEEVYAYEMQHLTKELYNQTNHNMEQSMFLPKNFK